MEGEGFQTGFRRCVRLSDASRTELLDRLDRVEQLQLYAEGGPGLEDRVRFRHTEVALTVEHPGGGLGRFVVCARKIGKRGMSFLHGGFLHFGTRCSLALPTQWGGSETARGIVCDCHHIIGSVHDVNVSFDQEIDPRQFVADDDFPQVTAKLIDPAELVGHVLLLDDQKVECDLLAHFLGATKISLVTFTEPGPAIDEIKRRAFDLVLCDLDLDTMSGVDVVKTMRTAGFSGPIIVLTGETNPARLHAPEEAGANAVVKKPYDQNRILGVLFEWLNGENAANNGQPIYSDLANTFDSSDLIATYLSHVAQIVHEMNKYIAEDNFATVRQLCLTLRETGASYGFEPVSETALAALTALDSSSSIAESLDELQQLKAVSKRIQAGHPPPEG